MRTRLFGEAVSKGIEDKESRNFSLKVKTEITLIIPEKATEKTLQFINSEEAILLKNAHCYEEFITKIFSTENKDNQQLLLKAKNNRQKSASWFSDYTYVYTYFALASAVAIIAADVVKNSNYQLTGKGHDFILVLLGSARYVGGLDFANKIAQVFISNLNNQITENL